MFVCFYLCEINSGDLVDHTVQVVQARVDPPAAFDKDATTLQYFIRQLKLNMQLQVQGMSE